MHSPCISSVHEWVNVSSEASSPELLAAAAAARCVCVVMPMSIDYIITEGRRRCLWEVLDSLPESHWLFQQSDFREEGQG